MDCRVGGALLPCVPSRPDDLRFDLGAIYRHHHRLVRWMVCGAGVPEHAVDDVTQDVFVAIHRRRAQAPRSELRRWIVGVTRSVCHSYRRGSARRQHRLSRTIEAEPLPLPDDLLDGRAALHRLRRALGSLAEPQREVFVLMELEGLSAPEVAAALGANLSTVYSRLRLARQRVWAEVATPEAVVARARDAGSPDRAQARQSWALVAARVGLEAGTVAPAAAATSTVTGWAGGLAIGACLGAAALGGLFVARAPASVRDHHEVASSTQAQRAAPTPRAAGPAVGTVPARPPRASPAEAVSPSASVTDIDRSALPRGPDAAPVGPRSQPRAPASTLADETDLLRRAAGELDAADFDESARLLDVHARRFADGVLAEERRRLLAELERLRPAQPG